jgi:hypothetical protein
MTYGVFSGYADYPADMRNVNGSIVLWRMRGSDYPADMRNSNDYKELWPKRFFS